MPEFYASTGTLVGKPLWGDRWRISGGFADQQWALTLDDPDGAESDLWFARRHDAERAVEALKAAGIETEEQLLALSSAEIRRIVFTDLAW